MSRTAKFFFSTSIFFLVVTMVGTGVFMYYAYQGSNDGDTVEVIVRRGTPLTQVADTLYKQEVIQYPKLFKWMLRVTRGNSRVRAGEFRFQKGMKLVGALNTLYHSEPIVHQVTIPEGWTIKQIAKILVSQNLVDEEKFVNMALNPQTAQHYKINAPSLEGFLFPDTYHFSRIDGEERILERMVNHFFENLTAEITDEMKAKGWTLEKLVTLASIIEKETGVSDERPMISSVFHNRLNKNMRLQSDPTTIYGIADFNGNLTKADLLRYSPYNTYTIPALPPGPIANPGMASILAALRPATSEFLYFVGNNNGSHIFSKTYGQHASHVNNYQKRGARQTTSTSSKRPSKKAKKY